MEVYLTRLQRAHLLSKTRTFRPSTSRVQPFLSRRYKTDEKLQVCHTECANTVKELDYEQYLVGLLLPNESRRAFFATRAFAIEVSKVREVVSNPMAGKIRLQWWRDSLGSIYKGSPPAHPVAQALSDTVKRNSLTRGWFVRIINKRDAELDIETPPTMEDLESFVEDIHGSLQYLALESVGVKNANADHAASHIGKAVGIAQILRGTPYQASKRRCYLPSDVLAKHGVSQEDLFRGKPSKALEEVVFEVSSLAKAHLDHGRSLADSVPKEAYPSLFSSYIADDFLTRLQKSNFNIFDAQLTQQSPFLHWKLLKAKFTKRF